MNRLGLFCRYLSTRSVLNETRFNNHNLSFNHEKHSAKTTLSKYVWELKARKVDFSIKWPVLKLASAYKGIATQCTGNLCLAKNVLCRKPQVSTLNAGCYLTS